MIRRRTRSVPVSGTRACNITREEEHELVQTAVRRAKEGEKVVIQRSGGCLDVKITRREQLAGPEFESPVAPAPLPVIVGKPEGE